MNKSRNLVAAVGILGGAFLAEAHLVAGSLSVKAGDKVKAGDVVNVKWTISVTHAPGDFDISVSTNGGGAFQKVETKKFPLSPAEVTYAWTVPNTPSTTAQIQICQHSGSNNCEYSLKSGNFTIEASSSILDKSASIPAPALRFDAVTRNLEVSFLSAKEERVTVLAFDAKGKVEASLLDGRYSAGTHKVSIFSNRLERVGSLVFQLRIGDQVYSFNGIALR